MLISEVIKKLQSILYMYGDVPLFMSHDNDDKDFRCEEVMQVEANHFLRWNETEGVLDQLNSVAIMRGQ